MAASLGQTPLHAGGRRRVTVSLTVLISLLIVCVFSPASLASQTAPAPAGSKSTQAQVAYRRGVALVRQGHFDEAIGIFDSGLQDSPRDARLLDADGAAHSFKGDLKTARGLFAAALAADPSFESARKNLAITYFALAQYDEADAEFRKLSASPSAPRQVVDLFRGMIAEKKGQYPRAVSLLQQAGSLRKQYPEALLAMASSALKLNQPRQAEDALHDLEATPNTTAAQWSEAADCYSQLGDEKSALAALDEASAKDPGLSKVEYRRAVLLDQLGRPKEAFDVLQKLTAKSPDSESLNLLAHVAEKTGDLEVAIQSLRQAAKLNPAQEDNYLDFSTLCADYGNFPLALEGAEVGLEHLPNSYRLLVQKGVVLQNLGRLDESQKVLEHAGTLQADNSVALLSLAIVQTDAGRWRDAQFTLNSAIKRFPGNYYMRYELGKILVHLDERVEVESHNATPAGLAFREAIRLNPSFADSYYQLAKLQLQFAPAAAEQNLNKCLQIDSGHAPAQYTLARLYMKTGRRVAAQAMIDKFEHQQQTAKLKEQQKPRIEAVQR